MDLIINEYGTKIGATGERIKLSFPHSKETKEYPIRRLAKIVILRPAAITTHAVKLALENDVDIVYLGSFGKPIGRVFSSAPKGLAHLRRAQLETSLSPAKSIYLAKQFIKGKCSSQINYLRYLGFTYKKDLGKEILQSEAIFETIDHISSASKEQLFGIEGSIAERYFRALRNFFSFPGRKPEGRDKFNSALNYGYGILYNEVEKICLYAGLDPYLGLYHSERYGKPSLVLDLVEEFRVSVVDSAVFPLFVEKKINKTKYFEKTGEHQYKLSPEGKSIIVEAVMNNLDKKVVWRKKHFPLRLAMENQIQALARYFLGKETYHLPYIYE